MGIIGGTALSSGSLSHHSLFVLLALISARHISAQNSFLNSAAGNIALTVNTATTPTVNIFTVQLSGTDKLYVSYYA